MTSPAPVAYIQGVQTTDTVVDPTTFATFTRRQRFAMSSQRAIAGLGTSDNIQLKKTGVISALEVHVSGSVVLGGTITGTSMSWEWPYNLAKAIKVSVNGQSTLFDTRGLDLKLSEVAMNTDYNDRGVAQRVGNATAQYQGTLSASHEDWGGTGAAANYLAPNLTVAATGTYPIDLTYVIPIAAEQTSLIGSIFGQSQATNINLEIVWASQADLMTLGGSATVSFTGVTFGVVGVAYSIPVVNGKATLPDLSQLHAINTFQNPLTASGDTEVILPGTGQGRKLLRLWWNAYSSAAPLAMTTANYGNLSYKYGANNVPELVSGGTKLRAINERQFGSDVGKSWGFGVWDFASEFALRDVIDLGGTSDMRLVLGLVSTPTSGKAYITQETLFAAAVGA